MSLRGYLCVQCASYTVNTRITQHPFIAVVAYLQAQKKIH